MPALVTLPFRCESPPEVRRRVAEAVRRVMSPMADEKRRWSLEVTDRPNTGPMKFAVKGFVRTDPNTMKVDKQLEGLSQEDLRAIYSELHDHFHGDEHG